MAHLTGLWHPAQASPAEQGGLVPVGLQLPGEDALEDGTPSQYSPFLTLSHLGEDSILTRSTDLAACYIIPALLWGEARKG